METGAPGLLVGGQFAIADLLLVVALQPGFQPAATG
jgi:hypothetical protein